MRIEAVIPPILLCSYDWIRKDTGWGRLLTLCALEMPYFFEPENQDTCSNKRMKYLEKSGLDVYNSQETQLAHCIKRRLKE